MRNFQLPGRSPVHATRGMVATSQPAAVMAGLSVLQAGGNAIDAAIAAAAVLAVVQPSSTGIGGDCFVLYAPAGQGRVIAYNGSGRAPAAARPEWFAERGIAAIEQHSPHAVTVPGAIDAWARLVEDHGTKGLDELLQPAIALARDGFPVHSRMAADWHLKSSTLRQDPNTTRMYLPAGRAPRAGECYRMPELADTLALVARRGRDAFYTGPIAEDIVGHLQALGGLHTLEDFATARGEYVEPIRTSYRDYDVHECPPNGQGIVALEMLNILFGLGVPDGGPAATLRMHRLIEASWVAYKDRDRHVCDPAFHAVPVAHLLSEGHAAALRATIRDDRALHGDAGTGSRPHNDTIYLCAVDRDGNAVSLINSLFASFGSGLTSPRTGVVLQNRGCGFVLDPAHPNCIGPRRRPMHTIIPGLMTHGGHAVMPFGVLGGHYQAIGHAALLTNVLDYGLDLQEAIDLARVYPVQSGAFEVQVEDGVPDETVAGLRALGHRVSRAPDPVGGAQAIWINWDSGVLTGGSDPRYDGFAAGW